MFGRRRRPILGAAVLVGASRSAARHEVQRQAVRDSQREFEIQQQVDMRRREEEELDRRTQRAVEEAMKKSAAEQQAAQQTAAAAMPQPPQEYYAVQSSMSTQTRDMGPAMAAPGQSYAPIMNTPPNIPPEQFMQPPAYSSASQLQDGRPRSAQDMRPTGSELNTRYCTECGFACRVGAKFCSQCGAKQVYLDSKVE